jgi:hypothetical protein
MRSPNPRTIDLNSLKKGQTVPYEGGEATVQRILVLNKQTFVMLRLPDNKFVKVTEIVLPKAPVKLDALFPFDTNPKKAKWTGYIIFAIAVFIALCIMSNFYIV